MYDDSVYEFLNNNDLVYRFLNDDNYIDRLLSEIGKELENHNNDCEDCDWDCENCEFNDEYSEADDDKSSSDDDIECDGDCENCEFNEDDSVNGQDNDSVNHPSHYCDGNIEVIDYIEDKQLGYHLGNAVKYISRAGKKHDGSMSDIDKEIEDLEKAVWYLNRYIRNLRYMKDFEDMLFPFIKFNE